MAKKGVPGIGVEVDTKEGVVTLSSTKAVTQAEKDKAITIAKHIKGVKAVMADGLKTE
jgi:hyperosmotically inducible protein